MVTASHNPAKYNGYKAYGPDGCQMTDEAADIVYAEIQETDILTGAKLISFEDGLAQGLIEYVGDDCINALYAAIEARSIRPGICKTAGLKLVYSPLNGSGLVPVTHVLNDMGITDITIVPEQEYPNGYFTTCSLSLIHIWGSSGRTAASRSTWPRPMSARPAPCTTCPCCWPSSPRPGRSSPRRKKPPFWGSWHWMAASARCPACCPWP